MMNLFFLVELRIICFLLVALLALGPIGCLNYGPISLKSERSKYNLAIQKTNDEQLLLNLVRLKYRDTPFFLEVGNVASQFKLKNKASITAQLESMVKDIFNLGASTSYEESPTVSYTPLQGDSFVKNILSTLPLKTITLLFHSGWSIERVFRVSCQLLGGLENAPGASGPTPILAPEYKEFLKAVQYLQEIDDRDALRINYQEVNGQPQMVLQILNEAKNTVIELSKQYKSPDPETFKLPGSAGRMAVEISVKGFLKAGKISEHHAHIAKKLAYVLTGGSKAGPFTNVDEQYLLDIEREVFVSLCGEQKSLERIKYMLSKGKPLRN